VNRVDLLHLIRAACDLLDVDEVVVFGSQAILATRTEDELPYHATRSREADIAAWRDPDQSMSHRLAGVLGEDSAFDHANGYFVDGVSTETAQLPLHWQQRALRLESYSVVRRRTVVGVCPEAHDLCVSKLCAFREKDLDFVGALLLADIVSVETLRLHLDTVPGIDPIALARAPDWLGTQGA
jgi:ribosome modulation factor